MDISLDALYVFSSITTVAETHLDWCDTQHSSDKPGFSVAFVRVDDQSKFRDNHVMLYNTIYLKIVLQTR